MSRHRIIALCGYKRSGKDTVADFLVQHVNYKKLSIATPLKECCKLLFGFTEDQMTTDAKDQPDPSWNGLTPRKVLQFFGTEMMQFKLAELMPFIGREFWITRLIHSINSSANKQDRFVIPDLRFKHEYEALRKAYGPDLTVIKVERPHLTKDDMHVSEQEWLSIEADIVIENKGTLQDLETQIMQMI